MAQRIGSYIKNVAKSFGYAIGDEFSKYNPVIASLGKETKETASDMYQAIKSLSPKNATIDEKSISSIAKNSINDAWNNFKDDIKSGNWYNKERGTFADQIMQGFLGDDFNMDLNFDDDWGDLDDMDQDTQAVVESDERSTRQVIGAMDAMGSSIANTVSAATVESATYIVNSSNRASRALFSLNEKGFNAINKGLVAINTNINSISQIAEPLTAHMQNSALFYTNTTNKLNDIYQSIKGIEKNTTPPPVSGNRTSQNRDGSFSSLFDSDGIFSIDSYKEMIKKNFGMTEEGKGLLDTLKSFTKDGSLGKNISPMKFVTSWMVGQMMPKMFKESMLAFNDSIKYTISNAFIKAKNDKGSWIGVLLKDFFMPKDNYKDKIDPGNYEKGAISWDGISRKALTDVIPTTLLMIYSALTGTQQQRYDYNTGKFVNVSSIQNAIKEQKTRYAQDAGGEFRKDALNKISNNNNLSKEQKDQLAKEIENYFYNSFTKGKDFFVNSKNFNSKDFGLSNESLAILQQLIEGYRKEKSYSKRNIHNKFTNDVINKRDDYGDYMRREELTGTNIERYLNDGLLENLKNISFGTDEYNHSSLFYLRGIYEHTGFLVDNISAIGGKVQDIADVTSSNESSAGEKTREESNESIKSDYDNLFGTEKDEKEEHIKEAKEKVSNKAKGIRDKIKGFFSKDNPKGLIALYNRPFNAVSDFMYKIGDSLDKLIWGDDEDAEKGIFGMIYSKTKKWFDSLDERFGIKDKFNKAKEKVKNFFAEDGTLQEFISETKDNLKSKASGVGKTIKQFFGAGNYNGTAAHGRKVTKSGVVSVSEGELIIPAEFNPYYRGKVNKKQQIINEANNAYRYFGSFADGGSVEDTKENIRKEKFIKLDNLKKLLKHGDGEGKGHQFIREGFETIGAGATTLFDKLFGSDDKETIKKDKSIIKTLGQKLLKEAGDNKGAMGAGAVLGAGASILTGAVVGPLFGAAIGSAVALTANSKTVQKILFGETDKDGNVSGGLLNKKVSTFMKQKLPKIGKGAAIGGAAGLFLGSPILGSIVGASVEYVRQTDEAKNFLFGDPGTNRRKKYDELKAKIKKASPNIAAGTILGAAVGPFGIPGNLIIGAGLGYLTTSKNFNDYMFGDPDKKGDKGLVGLIRTKILDNLDELFHNMGNRLTGWMKKTGRNIGSKLKEFLLGKVKASKENGGLLGKLAGAGEKVGSAVKGAVGGVGNFLGRKSSKLKAKNLASGYNVYDKRLKRNLTASERMELRGGVVKGSAANLDQHIAQLAEKGDIDGLTAMRDQLKQAKDPNINYRKSYNQAMSGLFASLEKDGIIGKKANKIAKYIESGDIESAKRLAGPGHEDAIDQAAEQISNAKNSKQHSKDILAEFNKNNGTNYKNAGDIGKALDAIDNELKSNKGLDKEAIKEKTETNFRDRLIAILSNIDVNFAKQVGGEPAKESEQSATNTIKNASDALNNQASGILNTDGNKDTTTTITANGDVMQFENHNGELKPNLADSETKAALESNRRFKESVSKIPLIGTSLTAMGGILGKLKNGLFGSEEEGKQGLFSKLYDRLFGDGETDGLLNSGRFGKIKLLFKDIIAPALLIGGFAGAFDGVGKEISGKLKILKGNDTKATLADNRTAMIDGKQLKVDEEGNFITNEKGEYLTTSGEYTSGKIKYVGSNTSVSKQMRKSVLTTAIMSQGSKVFGMKTLKNGKVTGKIMDTIAKTASTNGLISTINGLLAKIPKILAKIPFLPDSVKSGSAEIAKALSEAVKKSVTKAGSKASALLSKLSNLGPFIKGAYVVAKGINAWGNAESILGITEDATFGQKVIATLIAVVNALIPGIGDLIPNKVLVNIFMQIAPKIGIDVSDLAAQRERAEDEVKKYNETNGTELSIEEYNQMNGKAGIFTKIGNGIKSIFKPKKKKTESSGAGSGNGFVSQFDSRYKDMKFGNSTVAQKGCGPAVAAMIANDMGAKTDMGKAIESARKYQDNNGTKVDYFKDFLGSQGIETTNISGKNSSEQILRALSNGGEVILLGRDAKNKSKDNSPFGPNNHYVVVSGIDANGNLIVKDPENEGPRTYSSSILNSVTGAIKTNGSGGTSNYDTDIAQKVWGFFTSNGYSPAATAGIMGNLYQESGMNPERFQNKGPAAGIAQWESYRDKSGRWAALNKFAQDMGKDWTELDPQLRFIDKELSTKDSNSRFAGEIAASSLAKAGAETTTFSGFKNSTDPMMATRQFEGVFERAGKPAMENRLKAAEEYYRLYQDSSYTGNYDSTVEPEKKSIFGKAKDFIISAKDKIKDVFSNIFSSGKSIGSVFGSALKQGINGIIAGKSLDEIFGNSSQSTNSSIPSQAVNTDTVVNNLPSNTSDKQKSLVEKLLGIQGKLDYSMSGARNPEQGSADCSSTVNWAYKQVTGTDIGNDTASILNNSNTEIVDLSNIDKSNGGKNSDGPDLNKLMPGDIMLYSRPDSDYSKGRNYRVGHVEMYVGDGKRIGHGGGMGPKVTDATKDSSRYIMAKRLKGISDSAAGSGLFNNRSYSDIANMSGGSSGMLLSARPGSKINRRMSELTIPNYSGGASNIVSTTKNMLNNISSEITNRANKGSIPAELVEKLLNSIIGILGTISTNTSSVEKIYNVLTQYTEIKAKTDVAKVAAANKAVDNSKNDMSTDIDSNIINLVGTLAAIAKG